MEHKTIDRFRGCLYGQAIGDALGLGTECMTDEDISWKYPNGPMDYNTTSRYTKTDIGNVGKLATGRTIPT